MGQNIYQQEIDKLIVVGNYVYKQVGHGCQEHVYREVLELELDLRNIPYSKLGTIDKERAYFLCFSKIVISIDTHSFLTEEQENSFMDNLKNVGTNFGVLFNFGYKNLQYIKVGGQCVLL